MDRRRPAVAGARPRPRRGTAGRVRDRRGAARNGFAHADPHPDDVLVLPDGRLAILDFGATRGLDGDRFAAAAGAVEAFVADDADAFGAATAQLGALPAATRGPRSS